ncbi:MAG: GDP-mannose 4,6-dehydratase, partial [Bacteroidaceae bacterium]|nr:GDP-mannose 4,6-dehydratase [Bacteroidaceae bacterium]
MKTILVTGSAGFIGANLVLRLLESLEPTKIVGLDNLNNYYDPSLKEYRLKVIADKAKSHPEHIYSFIKGSIADKELVNRLFKENQFDIVVNLAAQAGVRYSIENPDVYIESNIIGFYNILEACRHSMDGVGQNEKIGPNGTVPNGANVKNEPNGTVPNGLNCTYQGVQHLVYASSSSVYG